MLNYARNTLKKVPTWGEAPTSELVSEANSAAEASVRKDKLGVRVEHLENLTEERIDEVASVLVKAFAGDPFGAILVGGNTSLNPIQLRATVAAANIGGTIHVATLPSSVDGEADQIVGVAVWFAPGQSQNSTPEQRAVGWDLFMEALDDETRKWWTEYFIPLMGRTSTAVYGDGTVLKSWDLHLFGVLPEFQGRGAAGALMRYADRLAKESEAPMVLSTQKQENVTIYSKLGFEVKGEVLIESRVGSNNFWILAKGL